MKRPTSATSAALSARVPKADIDKLEGALPLRPRTWLIQESLHEFNELVRSDPALRAAIKAEIAAMVKDKGESAQAEFMAKVSIEDYNTFNAYFGEYGSTAWFLRRLLTSFLASIADYPPLDEVRSHALRTMLPSVATSAEDPNGNQQPS